MRTNEVSVGIESALTAAVADDVTTWSDGEVRDGLRVLLAQVNRLDALVAALVHTFDARGLSDPDGFRTTRTWLTSFGRLSQGAASGLLSRARLQPKLPALTAAARDGVVSAEHLRKVSDLAAHVGVDAVATVDETLATLARDGARPAQMEEACRRVRAHIDPDGADPDPHAAERRYLSIARVGSLFHVSGKFDAEGGATLLTALDALMRPPTPDDLRTAGQRRADAAVELARQVLAGGGLPTVNGVRPQLGILITAEALLGLGGGHPRPEPAGVHPDTGTAAPSTEAPSTAAPSTEEWRPAGDWLAQAAGIPKLAEQGWNSWAKELPVEVVRRLACDSVIWRLVLDPDTGKPLNLGSTHRIVPDWMRKALIARDRGCRWPGCEALPEWCDAHHLIPWYFRKQTTVEGCLLLCRYHHRLVHHELPPHLRWRIDLNQQTGEVRVWRPGGDPYEIGPSPPPHQVPKP